MSGTPDFSSASATFWMAVIWGTPTPATIRVVQIEPGPMPTFTPSAPWSTSARAPSPVPTLPPTTSILKFFLIHCTRSSTRSEEHTSELQSLRHLVCRLLLEKKNDTVQPAHDLAQPDD